MNWVLIIALMSPGGDFMGKQEMFFDKKKDCETARAQLYLLDEGAPLHVKHKGVCVTYDHYSGKKPMPGVALD